MVNYTDLPIVICDPLEVSSAIKSAIKQVCLYLCEQYSDGDFYSFDSITSGPDTVDIYFLKFFLHSRCISSRKFSADWICEAFKFVIAPGRNVSEVNFECLLGDDNIHYRSSTYGAMRKGFWLALVILYREGYICLPANFCALASGVKGCPRNTRTDFAFERYPEIMQFLISGRYKLAVSDFWLSIDKKVRERIAQYGTRLFWMCGVTRPEQIILDEVIAVHLYYTFGDKRLAGEIPTRSIMQYICHYYGERVPFSYEAFLLKLDESVRQKRTGLIHNDDVSFNQSLIDSERIECDLQLREYIGCLVKRHYSPDRIGSVRFKEAYSSIVEPALKTWMDSQVSFMKAKNYERKEAASQGISALNIYLFEYLPRWYSFGEYDPKFCYPVEPKYLGSSFVTPGVELDGAPPSFKNFLSCTFKKAVVSAEYAIYQQLSEFFDYVEIKYQDVPGYEGFKNSILPLDMPDSERRTESKARPFAKWQYTIALNYLSCIFSAVRLINDDVLSNNLSINEVKDYTQHALALGWDPVFYCSGRSFKMESIPSVFLERWTIPLIENKIVTILSTHYLVHILTAIDSGLRHQSVRWLSTDFDKLLGNEDASHAAHLLHVAVDKVENKPVKSYVATKTLEALKYHRDVRSLVEVSSFKSEIFYRGNESTKKGKFIPLFSRNFATGHPMVETSTEKAYMAFLVAFNLFLNCNALNCKLFELKAYGYGYGEKVIEGREFRLKNGLLYCKLKFVTDMTPHHTRSSAVSNWSRYLSIEDVGKYKTAQKSVSTVRYYHKLDEQDRIEIKHQINYGVNKIWEGEVINASAEGSAFRKSLAVNPVKAIKDFGCISISPVSNESSDDGVKMIARQHHSGLAHYSTHICTRNGDCTDEMRAEGLENKCGLCIYAVKGIDNLEAIEVKICNYVEEVRALHEYADQISEKNQHELLKVDGRLDIVISDLLAWVWCRDHLISVAKEFQADHSRLYAYQPEILKRNFLEFNAHEESAEYVLSRLYQDSNFPELITDIVKVRYKALKVALMGNRGGALDLFRSGFNDSSAELVGVIKSMVKQSGLSVSELALIWNKKEGNVGRVIEAHQPILSGERVLHI